MYVYIGHCVCVWVRVSDYMQCVHVRNTLGTHCMCVCLTICIYIGSDILVFVCIYIYTYINTYICIYT
jgi:hypothetical protein